MILSHVTSRPNIFLPDVVQAEHRLIGTASLITLHNEMSRVITDFLITCPHLNVAQVETALRANNCATHLIALDPKLLKSFPLDRYLGPGGEAPPFFGLAFSKANADKHLLEMNSNPMENVYKLEMTDLTYLTKPYPQ